MQFVRFTIFVFYFSFLQLEFASGQSQIEQVRNGWKAIQEGSGNKSIVWEVYDTIDGSKLSTTHHQLETFKDKWRYQISFSDEHHKSRTYCQNANYSFFVERESNNPWILRKLGYIGQFDHVKNGRNCHYCPLFYVCEESMLEKLEANKFQSFSLRPISTDITELTVEYIFDARSGGPTRIVAELDQRSNFAIIKYAGETTSEGQTYPISGSNQFENREGVIIPKSCDYTIGTSRLDCKILEWNPNSLTHSEYLISSFGLPEPKLNGRPSPYGSLALVLSAIVLSIMLVIGYRAINGK